MIRYFTRLMVIAFLVLTVTAAMAQLRINEFMASNSTTYPGPQGDYPDWIEIYNGGSQAINLAGYWISDDLNEPDKLYQIPSTSPSLTTVQPGGFIVFIANGDPTGGVLNVNFKLSASGEHIGLWMPDKTTVVDTMSFDVQTTDVSMGLSPNGGSLWYFFNSPTPGASNPNYTAIPTNTNNFEITCLPNPCTDKTTIRFTLMESSIIQLSVFDLMGKQVALLANAKFVNGEHTVSFDTSQLESGLYFFKLKTPSSTVTRKLQVSR